MNFSFSAMQCTCIELVLNGLTCSELVMETTEIGEDFKKTMTFKVDLK